MSDQACDVIKTLERYERALRKIASAEDMPRSAYYATQALNGDDVPLSYADSVALKRLCSVCGKPAGPFGATLEEFCACDQRDGSTFDPPALPVLSLALGDRCPGCGVRCLNLDAEHLNDCRYIGRIELLYCTLGCTGPHHRPECALGGRVRYTR